MRKWMGLLAFLFGTSAGASALASPNAAPAAVDSAVVVVDVRTPDEFGAGHVKDARNIDLYDPLFEEKIKKLDRTKNYKLYCRTGNRSGQALRLMKSWGFTNVENVGGLQQAVKMLGRSCEGRHC